MRQLLLNSKSLMHYQIKLFVKNHYHWFIPLLIVLTIAPFTPEIDIAISKFFYHTETRSFSAHYFFETLYLFGEFPALLTGACAALIVALSFLFSSLKKWRNGALTLLLTLVVGGGILTNALLKEYWGRARPKQIAQFGGENSYSPFYVPNFSNSGVFKSFPSGHCAMGFFFFSLWRVGKKEKRKNLQVFGIVLTLILGSALTLSRIGQGGHFFSDAMMSALIMWYTSLAMEWFVYDRPH